MRSEEEQQRTALEHRLGTATAYKVNTYVGRKGRNAMGHSFRPLA